MPTGDCRSTFGRDLLKEPPSEKHRVAREDKKVFSRQKPKDLNAIVSWRLKYREGVLGPVGQNRLQNEEMRDHLPFPRLSPAFTEQGAFAGAPGALTKLHRHPPTPATVLNTLSMSLSLKHDPEEQALVLDTLTVKESR